MLSTFDIVMIVFGSLSALAVIAAIFAIVFSPKESGSEPAPPLPSVSISRTTPINPIVFRTFLIQDPEVSGCYEFQKIGNPNAVRLQSLCSAVGQWMSPLSGPPKLTYNGGSFAFCIAAPGPNSSGFEALASNTQCDGVSINDKKQVQGTVQGTDTTLCLDVNLLWNSCANAKTFSISERNSSKVA